MLAKIPYPLSMFAKFLSPKYGRKISYLPSMLVKFVSPKYVRKNLYLLMYVRKNYLSPKYDRKNNNSRCRDGRYEHTTTARALYLVMSKFQKRPLDEIATALLYTYIY